MSQISVKKFVSICSNFSHLYVRCNNHKNNVDIISVSPLGEVSRLCLLPITEGLVDYNIFMSILKKSTKSDLQKVSRYNM